ncbi:hypothetical protein CAI21_22255 [Alkalilimnicola ehrlichii]|uniref:Uncharacterized protein n=1 Tax=Alkalilimnicola ehrlichii TaxID=351052 RepID=A0A3E0WEZ9_9GAMM|nr:hypothetical protein CAI21_22255 [Alkalilimnicola ehrlichii]RFA31532.1 hypothetical protein CAL65_22425 [Alkalilimnicola ehrlichii]
MFGQARAAVVLRLQSYDLLRKLHPNALLSQVMLAQEFARAGGSLSLMWAPSYRGKDIALKYPSKMAS